MEELLRFKYKDKELCLFSKDEEFIYASIINGELNYDLTEEERIVLDKALTLTITSHDLTDLGYIKYNQKKFRHFYDRVRDFHLFYEGDNLNIPESDDLFNLNYIFNNQEWYVAIYRKENYKEKKARRIKRIIKIGSVSVLVVISLAGLRYSLNNLLKVEPIKLVSGGSIDKNYDVNIEEELLLNEEGELESNDNLETLDMQTNYQDYNSSNQKVLAVEDIARAIISNSNLTSNEKNFFLTSSKFFEDMMPYLNNDVLYKLRHFQINYIPDMGPNNCQAEWQEVLLTMKVYNASSFENCSYSDLSHEFIHIFSNSPNITLGQALYEFTTANMNNEYFSNSDNYDKGYNWLTRYGMPLIQLIGPDNIREYYANPRPNLLTNALMEIIPNYNMACHLLSNFDTFNSLWRNHYDADFQEKWGSTMNQAMYELDQALMQYYNAKYTSNNLENLSCLFYLDKETVNMKIAENLGVSKETKTNIRENPDAVSLKTPIKNFNSNDNSRMTLIFPIELKISEKLYTTEQLLTGIDGMKYTNIFEIDLKMVKDGVYKKTNIYTNNIEYQVPDVYSIENVNKK